MFRTLIFAFQIGLLILAGWWVSQRPGSVDISWLGYDIHARIGVVLFVLLIVLIAVLALHRLILTLAALPRTWRRHREQQRREKGYGALTLGLSAVAAGDAKGAAAQAARARKMLPQDMGLSLLLAAQAARLNSRDDDARAAYEKLLAHSDTAFLGLRGLLSTALERGEIDRALELAQRGRAMHPRHPWILRTIYDLELRTRRWASALETLEKLERFGVVQAEAARSDRIALLLQQAQDDLSAGFQERALHKLRRAGKLNPTHIPAALALTSLFITRNKRRAAIAVVIAAWKQNPHPEFVALWSELAPPHKPGEIAARLRWFEKLVALKPDDAESQLAAAKAAMEEGLWGEARQYLLQADRIRPGARLYRLWARLEERQGHTETAREYLEKAADAPPEKAWTCSQTGRVYERWHAVAEPHGAFNTIIWDYPRAHALHSLAGDPAYMALAG